MSVALGCGGAKPSIAGTYAAAVTETVELRNYWYTLRTPEIRLTADGAVVRLPTYFASTWTIPWEQLAVTDLTQLADPGPGDDVEFAELLSVPYFFTTGPVFPPNLLLTFQTPQRVPPLTAVAAIAPNVDLPFGYFSTRSEAGDVVDGMLLRVKDPTAAVAALASTGASSVSAPVKWLAQRRTTVQDSFARDALAARDRLIRNQALARAVCGYGAAGLLALGVLREPVDGWSVVLFSAAVVGGLAAWVLTRRLKRLTRRDRGGAGQ